MGSVWEAHSEEEVAVAVEQAVVATETATEAGKASRTSLWFQGVKMRAVCLPVANGLLPSSQSVAQGAMVKGRRSVLLLSRPWMSLRRLDVNTLGK